MPGNWDLLAVSNIARYTAPLVDRNQNPIPSNLVLLNRTPEVPRVDEEIEAQHTGHIYAADIIVDDEKAVVRTADQFNMVTSKIPNIKTGVLITQTMANLLLRLQNNAALPGEDGIVRSYAATKLANNILSIRIRMEMLLWAMWTGVTSYNKLGVRFSGIDWGMPSYSKIVPSTYFSNVASTPFTVISNAANTVNQLHGKTFNRIEMSRKVFNYIVATDQFKAQANLFTARAAFPTGSDPFASPTTNQNLLAQMLGLTLELRDESFEVQHNDGTGRFVRYMPEHLIVLSNSADDNNPAVREFSQAVVTESVMMNLPGVNVIGASTGMPIQRGPVGYATVPYDLNPPNATIWGVTRGMPRRSDKVQTVTIEAILPVAA
jgi:hypothetical protein